MPKATNKQKEKKADFVKAKLKLGKGKKQPSNATDTSFKARSIALPGQSAISRALAPQNHGEPLTSSGLVLDEVLIRLRHPNAGARRDALVGVKEILMADAERETGKVLRAFGSIVSDEDASVRKTLLDLMSWYLANISETLLNPHLPLFLLQVSSALSHIFADIRLDAAKLVYVLLDNVPTHVIGAWRGSLQSDHANATPASPHVPAQGSASTAGAGSTILEGLRLALGLGGDKASSTQNRLSAGGKLIFLRTMLRFFSCAMGGNGTSLAGIFKDWLPSTGLRVGMSASRMIGKVAGYGQEGYVVSDYARDLTTSETGWELGRLEGGDAQSEDDGIGALCALYLQLHPLILSTFLESAPSAFSPSSSSLTPQSASTETHLELCTVSCGLAEILSKPALSSLSSLDKTTSIQSASVRNAITDLVRRLSAYFPFSTPPSRSNLSATGITPSFALNLSYANLAVLLAPRPPLLDYTPLEIDPQQRMQRGESSWSGRVRAVEGAWGRMRETSLLAGQRAGKSGKGKGKGVDVYALGEVSEWVVQTLAPSQDALAPALTGTAFMALLPIIWSLVTLAPPDTSSAPPSATSVPEEIGTALVDYISRQGASSAARIAGDSFLISLIEVHEQRHPRLPFYIPASSPVRNKLADWVQSVPRALWELGAKDAGASARLLGCLLSIGQRGVSGTEGQSLISRQTLEAIPPRLAAYFWVSGKKEVAGPFSRLSDEGVKKLALDVARVMGEWDRDGKLAAAVKRCGEGV